MSFGRTGSLTKAAAMRRAAIVCAAACSVACGWAWAQEGDGGGAGAPAADPIRIETGQISGTALGEKKDLRVYRGVPFAAPPVGPLRWKPPQPAKPWEGVRACTEFSAWCPQPKPMMGRELGRLDEDCLYLNVWTPARTAGDKLSVMFWIHGGGYTTGSGSAAYYDGEKLARQGVVVVTINYRLGPFGFLAHPLLSKESEKGVSGNYGMLDQIEALRWVQRNIAPFGGDPGCVTIFGESAGAASVARLMVTPMAKGLFHRAIPQSGGPGGNPRHLKESWYGQESMEKVGERIAKALGCEGADDPLAALRAKTSEEILAASNPSQGLFGKGTKFWPVVDGWVMPDDPAALWEQGLFADVPFMVGSNADEGTVFLQQLPIKRELGYRFFVRSLAGDRTDEAMRLFPVKDGDVAGALNKVVAASAFIAPARWMARCVEKKGKSKAYLYHFTRVSPLARGRNLGAFHAAEIPYVFGTIQEGRYDEKDRELSARMNACWARFAKTGDPNGEGLPPWQAYETKSDPHVEFGDEVRAGSCLLKEACDLVDAVQAEKRTKRREKQPAPPEVEDRPEPAEAKR